MIKTSVHNQKKKSSFGLGIIGNNRWQPSLEIKYNSCSRQLYATSKSNFCLYIVLNLFLFVILQKVVTGNLVYKIIKTGGKLFSK